MSGKRKRSEDANDTRKLLSADDNDFDEEYSGEDDKPVDDDFGIVGTIDEDDEDDNDDDEDFYDDDYFKYLEADSPDNNSFLNETIPLLNSFSNQSLLTKAVPGTRKYHQIITSTPALAAKILTKNFKVKNFQCVFMEPNANNLTSFCIKTNSKKN